MENQIFPAICVRVAEEKDPQIIELFKDSLRLLLQEETPAQSFFNHFKIAGDWTK
jgi:hypothetical protein